MQILEVSESGTLGACEFMEAEIKRCVDGQSSAEKFDRVLQQNMCVVPKVNVLGSMPFTISQTQPDH